MRDSTLIVKLAAAGDVLLATALARGLRQARPGAHVAWLTTQYCEPLLQANPDLDEVLAVSATTYTGMVSLLARLRQWGRKHPGAQVLLAHRSRRLRAWLWAAGLGRQSGFTSGAAELREHRLARLHGLLRAAGVTAPAAAAPRLCLRWDEAALGRQFWRADPGARPRWVVAPGGARNPWSAMPNRVWPRERFVDLGRRAEREGIEVCWVGGAGDVELAAWITERLSGEVNNCTGQLSMRQTGAVIAASDLVIGNDSLPLILAQALQRPALGLYGPTAAAVIHAPGQLYAQGRTGCGPCYDPRDGVSGRAYRCPRARCMEAIAVDEVWRLALRAGASPEIERRAAYA